MKKIGLALFLLLISSVTFSQIKTQEFEKLDTEKVVNDLDTIKQEMDSTFYYVKESYKLLKYSVKEFGLKETIQMHSGIFLPIVIFLVLYLLWLKGRKEN